MRETGKPPRGGNYGIVREVRNENVVFKALAKTSFGSGAPGLPYW